jgi:putative MATE family efflux protein
MGSTDTSRPVWRQVLALALPALLHQYLIFFIQQYDQFLARELSPSHQAALTTANYLYWLVSSYSVVVSAGATAVVGRFVGGKHLRMADRATGQSVLLAAGFGLVGVTAGFLFVDELVTALRLSPETAAIAAEYLRPLFAVLVLQLIETGGIACLVGAGDTRTGLYVLSGVVALNVPTAAVLRYGFGPIPELGFVGIAWGTAVSHAAGGVAVLTLLARGRSGLKLHVADLLPERALMARLLRVSIPAAIDSLSVTACQFWFLSLVNRLGDKPAAAHGIAIRWEGLGYLAGGAFGTAAISLVSRSLGAGRPDLATRGARTALILGGGVMTVMAGVFYALAVPMCELYSPNDETVVRLGAQALRLVAFAMPALACVIIFTQALRGAGDTRVPVLFSWFGFLGIRIPFAYWLTGESMGYGLYGAWLAMFADIWARGVLFLLRFAGGKWKLIKV